MSLIPGEPFRSMENWRREMDKYFDFPAFFERGFNRPRIDIHETEDKIVAFCELPGIEKREDIQVRVKDNALEISGNINRTNQAREEQLFRKERYFGHFHRSVTLPGRVNPEEIKASYHNGILEISMAKSQIDDKKQIDIEFN